jgi:hypothetical protein
MSASDQAELLTLRTQVEDLTKRVTAIATKFGSTPDSAVAADLYSAERSLTTTRRSLDRAMNHLPKT